MLLFFFFAFSAFCFCFFVLFFLLLARFHARPLVYKVLTLAVQLYILNGEKAEYASSRRRRLPEVNLLKRACARELSTHFSVFEDAILFDVPSYPKHEYFALFCPRQMVQSTLFSVILITMFIRFTFFVIVV